MSLKGGQEEAGEGLPRTAQCLLSAFFRVRPVRNKEELAKENEEGGGFGALLHLAKEQREVVPLY